MLRPALLHALNLAYRTSLRPAWARFVAAADDPEGAQRARLERLIELTRGTAFAREHRLDRVRTLADLQDAVPIRDHDALAPWIDRVRAGEPRVLTREEPRAFEKTSGSTAASKYIPYTQALLDEFAAATGPWLHDMLTARPALLGGTAYWSISPSRPERERTAGGVPVGFEDDTEYFPPLVRRLLRVLLSVPPAVARLPDVESCRHATLRYLLADERLRLISVWNPSFLTLMLDHARAHAEALADDVARGTVTLPGGRAAPAGLLTPPRADPARAARVQAALTAEGGIDIRMLWPDLTLVSCWTDAAAARFVPALRRALPRSVEIKGKGLLATEGVVSFPLVDRPAAVLAVASHLIELAPADDATARPIAPHQAEPGGRYLPILSTGGGLVRYRLGDEVEVVGRWRRAPLCRFVGKVDGGSDLAGEKLTAGRVEQVLAEALADTGVEAAFCLLAPRWGEPPRYVLHVETDAPEPALHRLAGRVDELLREGHHYGYCRELGQLEAVAAERVRDGARRYERMLVARGMKAGDVKPAGLHAGTFWDEAFAADGDSA